MCVSRNNWNSYVSPSDSTFGLYIYIYKQVYIKKQVISAKEVITSETHTGEKKYIRHNGC